LEREKIFKELKQNGYPCYFINNTFKEWENNTRNTNRGKNPTGQIIVIPYVQGISEKFREDVRDLNIRVYFKNPRNLAMKLNKTDNKKTMANTSCIIYKVPCNDCSKFYIGETGRTWGERMKEHKRDILNKNKNNSIYVHTAGEKHNIEFWTHVDRNMDAGRWKHYIFTNTSHRFSTSSFRNVSPHILQNLCSII
jgi:hypothetical protein